MKAIILDDERSMLLILKKMLSQIPGVEIVGSFQSTAEAEKYIKENKVNLAFVDISMPEENGIDFARRIMKEMPELAIIFLTAHKEYALEAFEVHAYDYIVKPISQIRLENSVQRVRQRLLSFNHVNRFNMPKLHVYCFGGLEIRYGENRTIRFTSSKSMELFAYLLMKDGRFVSKWNVVDDVFRGMPLKNAETYLNTTVYKLRKALEPHGMKSAILSSDESYKLNKEDIYVDFKDFEQRVYSFSEIGSANYEKAIITERLYTGELFGLKDYCWASYHKERLSEMYWSFAKKLVYYLIENKQLTATHQILKKLLYINELDEEINCLLMQVYASQKDRQSLEKQFKRYKRVLQRELGVYPEKYATNLYNTLLKTLK